MTTLKTYDYLNRLTAITSQGGTGVPPVAYNYNYNAANQRTQDRLADGSYWNYQYDALGQVTAGRKFWGDGSVVAGQQFGYAFDTIGNRTQTQTGGDQNGRNLRVANYTANNLNQITSRDVPGYVEVQGVSFATNQVAVNGNTNSYRKGEYFRQEVGVANGSAAVWTNLTVPVSVLTFYTPDQNPWLNQFPRNFPCLPDQIQIILQPPKLQILHAALVAPQHLPRPAQFQIRLGNFKGVGGSGVATRLRACVCGRVATR